MPATLLQKHASATNGSSVPSEIDLGSFLHKDSRKLLKDINNLNRKVRIEKEYFDDSPPAMPSYGFGSDDKEEYSDDSFARASNKRMGLRSRAAQRCGDSNDWVNSRRAMKILDDEEQQDENDIMA